ncbi:serine protease [Desulfuromonas soudanensis]|uniref:Serine protease n=1 Tax=Desulfuromonas soudanensis TaxID=1603606 RepID=A0A0M4D4K5_9BACT|nr:SPFH domain-containing protein [Desulfuromonas soudanensis]ALC15535.1 serine protease [Desulfuromonas soudanensis]
MEPEQRFRLLQRARLKKLFKRTLLLLLAGLLLYYCVALVYATKTIYKVRRNYAVILEDLSGDRRVVQEVGWHSRLPFFTRLELEVPLMNQQVYLGGVQEGERIMSRGNVALWTSAMLTYRIADLQRWGIENKSPQTLLQNDFDGIVKDVMQSQTVDELISGRERIKEQIYRDLKDRPINEGGPTLEQKYGIEVVSFVLRDTRFGEKLTEASEEKKRRELIAEAENYAADLEASRTRKLYAAYRDGVQEFRDSLGLKGENDRFLFDFLNQQRWAAAYEKNQQGQNTFVLNNTAGSPPVVLPNPAGTTGKDLTTVHGQTPQNKKPGVRPAPGEAHQAD